MFLFLFTRCFEFYFINSFWGFLGFIDYPFHFACEEWRKFRFLFYNLVFIVGVLDLFCRHDRFVFVSVFMIKRKKEYNFSFSFQFNVISFCDCLCLYVSKKKMKGFNLIIFYSFTWLLLCLFVRKEGRKERRRFYFFFVISFLCSVIGFIGCI